MNDVGRRSFEGPPRVALEPAGTRPWLVDAIEAGGGIVVPLAEAEAIVWATPTGPQVLADAVASAPNTHWVQLPWAGIEPLVDVLDDSHLWTCGKGVYAEPVAEHVLMLALAGLRGLADYGPASTWMGQHGQNLLGANLVILGAGGITDSLLRLLGPFGCTITVVRRRDDPIDGADLVITMDHLDGALATADVVVLALSLTPETTGLFDARRLSMMKPTAWLVNVARGGHIVTDDLVRALNEGVIGGAALDVTDPEPLPDGHPLWSTPNTIITPHVGNTLEMAKPLLSARITENVRRFATGEPLIGTVDLASGY